MQSVFHKCIRYVVPLLLIAFGTNSVYAVDTYDAATGNLNIQLVNAYGKFYKNVVVALDQVLGVDLDMKSNSWDTYDERNNTLEIPAVHAFGKIYRNVKVSLGKIVSVEAEWDKGNSLVSPNPIYLPSLDLAFSNLCQNNTNLQELLIRDINGDGLKDLIFNLWCNVDKIGEYYAVPTKNSLIILLQDNKGNFYDGTKDMLGQQFFDMGGHGMQVVGGDFNGDGKTDFFWSINNEDGRKTEYPASELNAQNMAFMSKAMGGFGFEKIGQKAWNYSLALVDNEMGSSDVVSLPIGYGGVTEGWRFVEEKWTKINDYSWASGQPLFFKRRFPGIGSDMAVHSFNEASSGGISLRIKNSTEGWQLVDKFVIPQVGVVNLISWNNSENITPVTSVMGKNYIYFTLGDNMCQIKDGDKNTFIASAWGKELPANYHSKTFKESELAFFNKLVAFDVIDNKLKINENFHISNELSDIFVTKIICEDMNQDGLSDIQLIQWRPGSVPLVYINKGGLNFAPISSKLFPDPVQFKRALIHHYEDIDGDGVRDLLVIPTTGINSDEVPAFLLYKGFRSAVAADAN